MTTKAEHHEAPRPDPKAVRVQLDRILSSDGFRRSAKLCRFLEYIVSCSLSDQAGDADQASIAVHALGYDSGFDPTYNPAVRVHALRLRRALAHYFATEGRTDTLRIDLPKGSYVPSFVEGSAAEVAHGDDSNIGGRPSSESRVGIERSRGPSIAVLPFSYGGTDPSFAFLADGISEELAIGLSAFAGLVVVGPPYTLSFDREAGKIPAALRELGVHFILTGSVRVAGPTVRVATQLVATPDAAQVWAARMEGSLSASALFEMQDDITRRILSTVGDVRGVIPRQLTSGTRGKRTVDLTVYEATLLYHSYVANLNQEAHARARSALEMAVERDPGYTLAWSQLAEVYADTYALGYSGPEEPLVRARECATRAVALDPRCQEARAAMAFIRFLDREHTAAALEAEVALGLNPNSAFYRAWAGFLIGMSGQVQRGRGLIDEALALNPHLPGWLRGVAFVEHLEAGEYEAAFAEAQQLRSMDHAWAPLFRAVSAGHLGLEDVAGVAYRDLDRDYPEVAADPEATISVLYHFDRWISLFLAGLEKAKAAAARM